MAQLKTARITESTTGSGLVTAFQGLESDLRDMLGIDADEDVSQFIGVDESTGKLTVSVSLIIGGQEITDIDDDDELAADSDSRLATQSAIKSYVDGEIAGVGGGGVTDHGALTGLDTMSDHDHPMYGHISRVNTWALGQNFNAGVAFNDANPPVCAAAPSASNHLVNKTYADTQDDLRLKLDGTGTMSGTLNMGTNPIENVTDPTNNQDAATKKWVTDNFSGGGGSNLSYSSYSGGGVNGSGSYYLGSSSVSEDGTYLIYATVSGLTTIAESLIIQANCAKYTGSWSHFGVKASSYMPAGSSFTSGVTVSGVTSLSSGHSPGVWATFTCSSNVTWNATVVAVRINA